MNSRQLSCSLALIATLLSSCSEKDLDGIGPGDNFASGNFSSGDFGSGSFENGDTGDFGSQREDPVPDAEDGVISGTVLDALSDTPIPDVLVAVPDSDVSARTDADGTFRLEGVRRNADSALSLQASGYIDERYEGVRPRGDGIVRLDQVRLVPSSSSGLGGVSGSVSDAATGEPAAAVSLRFRRGINNRTGEVVASTNANAVGDYTVQGLAAGNVTAEISGEGRQTVWTTIAVLGGIDTLDQNASISNFVEGDALRIVLSWGRSPRDLDSHLTGPSLMQGGEPFHLYFVTDAVEDTVLDVDDVTSFGPETVTLNAVRQGTYRYSVHNFSGGGDTVLARSGARVQVLDSAGVRAEFSVPNGRGDVWTVFDIIDGEIVSINTIVSRGRSDDVYFAQGTARARPASLF